MTVVQAAGRAHELATIAALQTELTHVRSGAGPGREQVGELQAQLADMETGQTAAKTKSTRSNRRNTPSSWT